MTTPSVRVVTVQKDADGLAAEQSRAAAVEADLRGQLAAANAQIAALSNQLSTAGGVREVVVGAPGYDVSTLADGTLFVQLTTPA